MSENNNMDQLLVSGVCRDAVFFHLPEEPDGYLSNWFLSSFFLDGRVFSSAEQYMMYRKCVLFGDNASAAAVLGTDDPAEQQRIGRKAAGFQPVVWNGRKQALMFRGLMAKFTQNGELKKRLLDTGDAYLAECARSDVVWACGRRLDEPERCDMVKWRGQNLLGFTLMEVREALRE